MESSRNDDALAAALSELRPVPRPAFAAELDERAAAGFPRRDTPGASPWAQLVDRVRALSPRQILLPSAATALTAVMIATVVLATNQTGTSALHGAAGSEVEKGPVHAFGSGVEGKVESHKAEAEALGGAPGSDGENASIPTPRYSAQIEAASASAGEASRGAVAQSDATAAKVEPETFSPAPAAPGAKVAHRDVERSAQIVLGAEPDQVSDAASKVFEAVHAAHGIVLSSTVRNGAAGEAGAQFELLIPSGRLDDALGAFSGIGEVLSRRDGTADITAPTVGATERLQDSRARIDALLNELAGSETGIERETLEEELRSERRRSGFLQSQVTALQRRASLSHVSLRIQTGAGAHSSSAGGWDLGNAVGDAGHILAVAAGVLLIGLAVLLPVALIALVLWLGSRAWVRHGRRRALD